MNCIIVNQHFQKQFELLPDVKWNESVMQSTLNYCEQDLLYEYYNYRQVNKNLLKTAQT